MPVGVSIGVASLRTTRAPSAEALIHEADVALYTVKDARKAGLIADRSPRHSPSDGPDSVQHKLTVLLARAGCYNGFRCTGRGLADGVLAMRYEPVSTDRVGHTRRSDLLGSRRPRR